MNQSEVKHIVNEKVKLEHENILQGSEDECENYFIKSKEDEEIIIATRSYQKGQKRKRTQ